MSRKPKIGDVVEVRNASHCGWEKHIFLEDVGSIWGIITVKKGYEEKFRTGQPYKHSAFKEVRKYVEPKKTKTITIDGESAEISLESLEALKKLLTKKEN